MSGCRERFPVRRSSTGWTIFLERNGVAEPVVTIGRVSRERALEIRDQIHELFVRGVLVGRAEALVEPIELIEVVRIVPAPNVTISIGEPITPPELEQLDNTLEAPRVRCRYCGDPIDAAPDDDIHELELEVGAHAVCRPAETGR